MNSTRYFIDLNSIRGGDFIPEALEAPEKSSSGIDGSGTAMTMGLVMVYTAAVVPLEGHTIHWRHFVLTPRFCEVTGRHNWHGSRFWHKGSPFPRNYRTTLGTHNEASKWMATVFLDSTTTVAVHTAAGPLEGMTRTGITVPVFLVADFYTASVQQAATTSALSRAAFAMSTVAVLPAIAVLHVPPGTHNTEDTGISYSLHGKNNRLRHPTTHSPCDALRRLLDANHQDALDVAPRYEKIGDFDSRTKNTRNWCSYNGPIIPTKGSSLPQPPFTAVIASSSQPLPALSFFRRSLPVADKVGVRLNHLDVTGALVLPRLIHLRLFDNHGLRCTVQQGPEMCLQEWVIGDIIRENFVAHLDAEGLGRDSTNKLLVFSEERYLGEMGNTVSTAENARCTLRSSASNYQSTRVGSAMLSIEIGRTFDDKRHAIFLDAHQRHCRPPSPHRIDASRFWAVVTADANSDDFGNCTSLSVIQYLDDYWPRKHWTDDDCEQSRALSSAVLGWAITVDVRLSEYLPDSTRTVKMAQFTGMRRR
ncbi:hypothetical protein IW262DRAFT_1302344 [Armillaria fumosa]|nr:hypothetical protein IW262DRAFT_1302344 [Armillaria fumosa]